MSFLTNLKAQKRRIAERIIESIGLAEKTDDAEFNRNKQKFLEFADHLGIMKSMCIFIFLYCLGQDLFKSIDEWASVTRKLAKNINKLKGVVSEKSNTNQDDVIIRDSINFVFYYNIS